LAEYAEVDVVSIESFIDVTDHSVGHHPQVIAINLKIEKLTHEKREKIS
jgi:hypothetical protein